MIGARITSWTSWSQFRVLGLSASKSRAGRSRMTERPGDRHHYDGTSKQIHPVDQARDGKYALRAYVEKDPRWGSRSRVRWAHAVVFPFTELPDDFATPDCPRSMGIRPRRPRAPDRRARPDPGNEQETQQQTAHRRRHRRAGRDPAWPRTASGGRDRLRRRARCDG